MLKPQAGQHFFLKAPKKVKLTKKPTPKNQKNLIEYQTYDNKKKPIEKRV
jgi:hypothetical protein